MEEQVPPIRTSNAFSSHITNVTGKEQTRIAIAPGKDPTLQLSLAVVDQLLVAPDKVTDVLAYLRNQRKLNADRVGTVFQGLGIPEADDVAIVKVEGLQRFAGPKQQFPTVFTLTDELRTQVLGGKNPELVAPNRVLVPAGLGAGCPYGPPSPAPDVSVAPPPAAEPVEVTVIDSGYQDWWKQKVVDRFGRTWGPWGRNPLDKVCHVDLHRAQYLPGGLSLGQLTAAFQTYLASVNSAGYATSPPWHPGTPDVPCTRTKNTLDALAGHANFVAGVIAQGCDHPTIHVWSHNGSFVAGSDDFPVEASVCRSIVRSQQVAPTKVIHVGFAFPLRAKSALAAETAQDFLSTVWHGTFQHIPGGTVVVAPAGNEAEADEHYPAALPFTDPSGPFGNVVGVASLTHDTYDLSTFTNHGDWVKCSAVGEHVQSTFFPARHVKCEDDPAATASTYKSFDDGWATWNGTSFAAPKVAAAIAARAAAGTAPPPNAWKALTNVYGHPGPHPGAGIRFTNL